MRKRVHGKARIGDQEGWTRSCMILSREEPGLSVVKIVAVLAVVGELHSCSFRCCCFLWSRLACLLGADPYDYVVGDPLEQSDQSKAALHRGAWL